jgi:hypothetical protein
MSAEVSREDLIDLCRDGIVPQSKWLNRDSAGAQRQLGEAWALLSAGCNYRVLREGRGGLDTNDRTIWLQIESEGFAYRDYDGPLDSETYYIPTRKRLNDNLGSDWY